MAKKEVDGEGVNIPNRIKALPLFRNVVEAVPASLRTRAYRFLASGG